MAALLVGVLTKRLKHTTCVVMGAALTSLAVLPANHVGLRPLMSLWLLAGAGQNWVNLSTQTLIAEQTDENQQGRMYGAHFAWSHLWWAFAYPPADGWVGASQAHLFYWAAWGLGLLGLVLFSFRPRTAVTTRMRQ